MNTLKLLFAEIRYRKIHFFLSLVAVTVAVMLFVAGPMLIDGYEREVQGEVAQWHERVAELEQGVVDLEANRTRLKAQTETELADLEKQTRMLMREMGFNLMVVHRDTNMNDFWASDFAAVDMPQEYVDRLAGDPRLVLITHLVATLQQKITWEDRKVLLVGYLPESTQSHKMKKAPMGYRIEPGTALLGYELGIGRKQGDAIEVLGKSFQIAHLLPEKGSKEDITLAVHLSDAQTILDKPGLINQIMALGCHCADSDLPHIRKQLAEILPETHISEFRSIALARAEQRTLVESKQGLILAQMEKDLVERKRVLSNQKLMLVEMQGSRERVRRLMETLAEVITPLVVLASAVWVGLLALSNVRQRRTEIGLLRALGKGSGTISLLFLGKALILGLLGAAIGYLLGIGTAKWLGVRALDIAAEQFALRYDILAYALFGAPLLSAMASYLPTLAALIQDPAIVLRDG